MAGATMTVRIQDAELSGLLDHITTRARNLRPAMKAIGERLLLTTEERFTAEEDPDGNPWQPLASRTILASLGKGNFHGKRGKVTSRAMRNAKGRKILTRSHQLRRSLTYRAGADFVEEGTNKIYGAIHQLGGKAGRGRKVEIPQRAYLGITDADRRAGIHILKDFLGVK